MSSVLKYVLFADDTNIFCTGKDIQQIMKVLSSEMNKVKLWFDRNKLSLNLNKTKCMVFGNCKNKIDIKLIIDHIEIERVHENKFLGVILTTW